ncbi:MAG TPA: alpha/beta fold hydrolase [Acidobacteriota bacterium]|nr:alpha/beta fold hydrolase [Acidobacteriota bacterium]
MSLKTWIRNRSFWLAGGALLTVLAVSCSNAPTDQAVDLKQYDAKTFFETLAVTGASFSPDESKVLFTTDASGVFNAYEQPVEGEERKQLTESADNAIFAIGYFPKDERFLYTFDEGGNELNHIHVRETDGSSRDLTPGEGLKAIFAGWSGDRSHFWVQTNERDSQFFDLYRYSSDDYERSLVVENKQGWQISAISRDSRWAALLKVRNNADNDIYLMDLENPGEPKHVTPHEGDVSHSVMTFTPDSSQLIYSTNAQGEFSEAWSYTIADEAHAPVLQAEWDVAYMTYSRTGRYRVSAINADAVIDATILDTETGQELEMPEGLPQGQMWQVAFSPSDKRMAFYINSDTSPSNLFVMDLEDGSYRQLTHSLNPDIDPNHLVEGEVVRYKSFDGLEIPSILYRPHQATPESPAPAMVWVHGGPGGQSIKGYNPIVQHLVNHGYAVLAVNNRGSSGYGKTFFHKDDQKHGEVDLQDCVYGRTYLESLDWIDGEKIGIIGGSYGGYMVAAALAFEPEVFDVGIDIFGVTNWVRTLSEIPPWWAAFRDALYAEMGNPAEDEERLRRISPLFHADQIKRPLLVVQGANDPRVQKVESDEIVEAVRQNGVPVEYVVFDDEGHGFQNRDNRIEASERYLQFLDKHLKKAPAEATE